ncbi:MAG: papain-like cysteine protease family protein [Verrucomicrobiota bacterium]
MPLSQRFFCCCGVSLQLLATSLAQNPSDTRIWESVDGRRIEAKVLSIDHSDRTVRLQRTDGMRFTIQFDQLSTTDNEQLEAWQPQANNSEIADLETAKKIAELPKRFTVRNVPMVKQELNYCVPASAAMIASFHGLKTDQYEIARMSSGMSESNEGTYPRDMLFAMKKLGFDGQLIHWKQEEFNSGPSQAIKRALVEKGPVYISFRPGVFGDSGHGCVIVGYDDGREEFSLHNPWGNKFKKSYLDLSYDGYGIAIIAPQEAGPLASDQFIEEIMSVVPKHEGDFLALYGRIEAAGQKAGWLWCSRADARNDEDFARDTARYEGRKILERSFKRNPAVLIPYSPDGVTGKFLFVTRPAEGGARFMVHEISTNGWNDPSLWTIGSLTRYWTTAFSIEGNEEKIWELPMIELHPGE